MAWNEADFMVLERIASALERIAEALEKGRETAKPPVEDDAQMSASRMRGNVSRTSGAEPWPFTPPHMRPPKGSKE